jgi:hypothetical protein
LCTNFYAFLLDFNLSNLSSPHSQVSIDIIAHLLRISFAKFLHILPIDDADNPLNEPISKILNFVNIIKVPGDRALALGGKKKRGGDRAKSEIIKFVKK